MYKIAVFLVLCANTEGTSYGRTESTSYGRTEGTSYGRPEGLPSVAPSRCALQQALRASAKELGCCPKGTLRRGQKPRYENLNSEIKNAVNIS